MPPVQLCRKKKIDSDVVDLVPEPCRDLTLIRKTDADTQLFCREERNVG